jgi:hypothetical protein
VRTDARRHEEIVSSKAEVRARTFAKGAINR